MGRDRENRDAERAQVGAQLVETILEDPAEPLVEPALIRDGRAADSVRGFHPGGPMKLESEWIVNQRRKHVIVSGEAGGKFVGFCIVPVVVGRQDDEMVMPGETRGAVQGVIESDGGRGPRGEQSVHAREFPADSQDIAPAAVRLDLDASTVAFHKNGAEVGSARPVAPEDAYHFVFEAYKDASTEGSAVTIIDSE